ncbi:MAG: hypothetical protein JSS02_07610 [Planctomycetes bacterium]|nr:hypothetical protein [Planctomycetota bacterium]
MSLVETNTGTPLKNRYRLPGIEHEGIAQLSLLETALWPLRGGTLDEATFRTTYSFKVGDESREAFVNVYAPLGLEPQDEYLLWGLLGASLGRQSPEPTLLATPYWIIKQLDMPLGGYQYDQLRRSLERLSLVAYQNTGFWNPVTQQHERVTMHFLSSFLPTRGRGGDVVTDRAWRIEWSPMFFQMCQATGGTLLFDLDLYQELTPASRRLFLKLKDRFWRSKRVFLNVDDLTINGLGFSAERPLKKRKYDLIHCIQELLDHDIIELGRGQSSPQDLFIRRSKGLYVVQFFEGAYFRQAASRRTTRQQNAILEDPLYEPLKKIGVGEHAIRHLFESHSRQNIQRWVKITDAAIHEKPRGFPGFKVSPAAFLIDGIQNQRMPPDWIYRHEKEQQTRQWEQQRAASDAKDASLRADYTHARQTALQEFLRSPEGRHLLARFTPAFEPYYQATEPHRYQEAAREAATSKIEKEHFVFPEFGVWLLERRPTA